LFFDIATLNVFIEHIYVYSNLIFQVLTNK